MLVINIVRDKGEFVIDRRPVTELFGELEASGAKGVSGRSTGTSIIMWFKKFDGMRDRNITFKYMAEVSGA